MGQMPMEDFNDSKKRYEEQISKLQCELAEHKAIDANFMKYMDFTLQLIEKIDYFYAISPVEVKQKILVSIFPEKLIFDTKKYRTSRFNEVISVITRKDKVSRKGGNEKVGINADLSTSAPSAGLEPATL
jgi:site-specific DNA recombinase